MCGLPGSGKSTLSRALAARLGALRWDKDELRHLLFPPGVVEHDRPLNDQCMELLYSAAREVFTSSTARVPAIILDGRPYLEERQRRRVREIARQAGARIALVLCTAPLGVLRERVRTDAHPARDRDAALLERLAIGTEAFEGDEIVIDTASLPPDQAVSHCLRELRARGLCH